MLSSILIEGLKRLEYRGYDSVGVAIIDDDGNLMRQRVTGRVRQLTELCQQTKFKAHIGIGHTRWATHGEPNNENAHPHLSQSGDLSIIHNGIIENYLDLRLELERHGHVFKSDTDTEVAAHLLNKLLNDGLEPLDAMRRMCAMVRGSYAFLVIDEKSPGKIFIAKNSTPIIVGRGDEDNFIASDIPALLPHTRRILVLEDGDLAEISAGAIHIENRGMRVERREEIVSWDPVTAQKGGYKHFMLKEIYEQPRAVADTLLGRIDHLDIDFDLTLKNIEKIVIIACGTAFHAGLVGKYALEKWTGLTVDVELASEYRYREPSVDTKTLLIPISQSGETMDTLMALRHAKEQRAKVISVCNTHGTSIPRESDGVIYTQAGPEIAVASTKAFLTQIVATYLIGLYIAQTRGIKFIDEVRDLIEDLEAMPERIERYLETSERIKELAHEFKSAQSILFLGRHVGYPVALEGALKLKELAYMHAEGFAAGELKHGPIALIEEGTPVLVIMPHPNSVLHDKMVSNVQEIEARGARAIIIAAESDSDITSPRAIRIPDAPILFQPLLAVIPLQLFAYESAVIRGYDVDQPRNLAKSVTVE